MFRRVGVLAKSGVSDLDACFDQNYLQSMKSWYLPGFVVPMLWVRYPPYFLHKTKLKLEINTFFWIEKYFSSCGNIVCSSYIQCNARCARSARKIFWCIFSKLISIHSLRVQRAHTPAVSRVSEKIFFEKKHFSQFFIKKKRKIFYENSDQNKK